MTKEIMIRFRDGEKESELRLADIQPEHQLALMDGVFKFFDLDIDFKELATIYHKSGKAFQEFFNRKESEVNYQDEKCIDHIEDPEMKEPITKTKKIDVEQFANAIQSTNLESEETHLHQSHAAISPEHFVTGIKYDALNRPLYKCRYKCPQCGDESNHYIKTGTKHIRCWKCQRMLKVSPATSFGEPEKDKDTNNYRDINGNFYVAGAFETDYRTLADAENDL